MRAVFEHDFRDRVGEISSLTARDKVLDQGRGTVYLGDYEHARECGAVRRSDERDLQRRLELHVLRNVNENSRLHERSVQRSQTIVVIARVTREILANDLRVTRVAGRMQEIGSDHLSERACLRQVITQETIHKYLARARCFGIRKTTRVHVFLAT